MSRLFAVAIEYFKDSQIWSSLLVIVIVGWLFVFTNYLYGLSPRSVKADSLVLDVVDLNMDGKIKKDVDRNVSGNQDNNSAGNKEIDSNENDSSGSILDLD